MNKLSWIKIIAFHLWAIFTANIVSSLIRLTFKLDIYLTLGIFVVCYIVFLILIDKVIFKMHNLR